MKKIFTLVLMVMVLFSIAIKTNAATTLFIGSSLGARETASDIYFPGELSNIGMNLTYIKKIEISFEFQRGETTLSSKYNTEFGDFKIGYPVMDNEDYLMFLTAGYMRYVREKLSESQGFMLGADLIAIASDNFYVELDFQYSLFGASYRRQTPINTELPMDQISAKLKTQFILTDNLGLVANFHLIHFDANGGFIVEEVFIPSLGVIYRF